MSAMRLGMFVHFHDDRAVCRHVAAVCRHLPAFDVQPVVISVADTATQVPFDDRVEKVTLQQGCRRTALAVPALARALRQLELDVLFAHLNGPGRSALLARALGRAKPAVVPVEHVHYSTFYRHRHRLQDPMTRFLYERADRVAGVSPGVVEELERAFPRLRGRTVVLPPTGPDDERLVAADHPPQHPWLNGSRRGRVVCSVGNIVPRKGQEALVRALPHMRAALGEVRLLLVGRFDDEAFARHLVELARELDVADHLSMTGYIAEPLPFIAHSDAFVLASETEGGGMVLVEALACGTPVVSTDCPVGPRYILDNGRYGGLVPVNDERAIAAATVGAMTGRSLRQLYDARQRAADFRPRVVAGRHVALAQEVLQRRRSVTPG